MIRMTDEEIRARMAWLVAEIDRHDRLYYVEARPVIGDRDYDVVGAHACSLPVAAVLHGYGDREELKDADYILENFMDLVSLY